MKVYVAAQPIFDKNLKVKAYELLYRSGEINKFDNTDSDIASSQVILNSFQNMGIEKITNNKPAFINFTKKLLMSDSITLFSPEQMIIELLEDIEITNDVIDRCRYLKELGYTIVLDDFIYTDGIENKIDFVDIIKFDFIQTPIDEIKNIIKKLDSGIELLAEKIETHDEYQEAINMGFSYFQGYFFCEPQIHSGKNIVAFKPNYYRLMALICKENTSFDEMATIISQDVSLSYKLLRLVNSAYFGLTNKISNLQQALLVIGQEGLKKWVALLSIKDISGSKPDELIRITLIRAKFAENIAVNCDKENESSTYFLLGMLTTIDALLDKTMSDSLSEIDIHENLKNALINFSGPYSNILKVILAYESQTIELPEMLSMFGYSYDEISQYYLEAIYWYDELFKFDIL